MIKVAVLFLVLLCGGCASWRSHPVGAFVPPADVHTYNLLDLLLIPALLAIAAGVAIMVWLPVKKTGLAVIAFGASLAFSVLFYHALLPYMPWVVLAALTVGAGYVIYKFWQSHQALEHLACGKPLSEAPKLLRLVEGIRAQGTKELAKALKP